jgi:hypothetical protein
MMFDPAKHLSKLKGSDYLEVKWRIVWFRDRSPKGSIVTEAILLDWKEGVAIFKATVEDGDGAKATGTGTEMRKSFEDFVEKAETRAIGRALAALGLGTQFVGEELSERVHIADAPVGKEPRSAVRTSSQDPAHPHPTADQVSGLIELVKSCDIDLNAFAVYIRGLMQVDEHTDITRKFLRESMTVAQYDEAWNHYTYRQQGASEAPGSYATPAQLEALRQLAQTVGDSATLEVQELLEYHPDGLVLDVYELVKKRLLEQQKVSAASPSKAM